MNTYLRFLYAIAVAIALPSLSTRADLVVDLSSPQDLTALKVGDTVTIEATLGGTTTGDELNLLSVNILLPESIFATPTDLTPGVIVPDAAGFTPASIIDSDGMNHSVLATYDDSLANTAPISSDGLFFSFTSSVIGVGSGVIDFDTDFPLATGVNTVTNAGIFDATGGPGLAFVSAIPEPSSATTLILIAGIGFCRRGRKLVGR
ncbi:MAG: hypothetical protein AAFX06_01740 [Planctomycetota bacterium]